MTMTGLEIDSTSQQFKRKMLNLSGYPPSLIHETLAIVGAVYKKYIVDDDVAQSRNPTCIFDELEQLQHAMIVMQNSLFAHRQEINKQIKQSTSTLVTTRRQAIAMNETRLAAQTRNARAGRMQGDKVLRSRDGDNYYSKLL